MKNYESLALEFWAVILWEVPAGKMQKERYSDEGV